MKLRNLVSKLKSVLFYPLRFKYFGNGSLMVAPLKIDGCKNIIIGNRVYVQAQTWLACVPLTGGKNPTLQFGEGCVIGHFNHIYATQSIVFEANVLTADRVYISDNLHNYTDINTPIVQQPICQINPVVIGEGSWLGENVCIIGASIGKHCVIGANAVVTRDIPDYSVAVGVPARVIKQYNFETEQWETK